MRRLIGACVAVFLGVMLLGCQSAAEPQGLRFGLASPPISLDPRYATDATSARINRLIYRRLVDFDDASRPVPSLADWQLLTATHYRFSLRANGREFHDGTRLTARDVKTTYDTVLNPATASPHRASLSMIERIEVMDEDTVDFHLNREDPLFPGYLVIGILPEAVILQNQRIDKNPVGSGPFVFHSWVSEGRLVLRRRNDGERLEFIHVPDATVRVLKLLRGEIDMLQNDLPKELVSYLEARERIRVQRRDGSNFTYLGFNLEDPALARLEVRKAVAHALDRESIARYVLGGKTRLAGSLLPPDHWAGNPDLTGYEYDPKRARQLLRELGFSPEHPLEISYKTSSDPFRIRIATILQRQLAEVGIRVNLQSYDWATFYGDIKSGRFQLYGLSWVGVKSPDIFRYVFYSNAVPPLGANRGHYASPVADRLIDEAEGSEDMRRRADSYRRLQAHLLESLPYVPLWYEEHFYAARADIAGYRVAADGNYDGLIEVRRLPAAAAAMSVVNPEGWQG